MPRKRFILLDLELTVFIIAYLILGLQNGEIVEEKSGELVATEASLSQSDHRVATEIGIYVVFFFKCFS